MLIPAFSIFGSSVAVLRATNLFWQLIALLFLMLAARCWFGLATALIAGVLLVFDPTFLFLSVLDWGVAGPELPLSVRLFLLRDFLAPTAQTGRRILRWSVRRTRVF
jgi:hypothetical protein